MPTNDFLQFATGGGANVESQAAYLADATRTNGNQPGVASSSFVNKSVRQANYVASNLAQMMADFTGADVLDDTVTARFLQTLKASLQRLPPVITPYTSGSGNHNLTYKFFIATGSATTGATYTNNTVTFTVTATIASGTLLQATGSGAPTVSGTLTKASGTGDATLTFYAVRVPIALNVIAVGGGGGGIASGSAAGAPGDGGDTTVGSTIVVAGGGKKGATGVGGAGGTPSLSGAVGIAVAGGHGGTGLGGTGSLVQLGQAGAGSAFGGEAATSNGNTGVGTSGATNTGAGGAGASSVASGNSGDGGGSGAYVNAWIVNPASTYAYAVGAGGTHGTAGAGGTNAGDGGSGNLLLIECYQ